MRDLYNLQIGFRAAIYCFYRYSTPVRALKILNQVTWSEHGLVEEAACCCCCWAAAAAAAACCKA